MTQEAVKKVTTKTPARASSSQKKKQKANNGLSAHTGTRAGFGFSYPGGWNPW
jgi:hypothetical protein